MTTANLTWPELHAQEFKQPYFKALKAFLTAEIEAKQTIYPPPKEFLAAFDLCPWENTKVIILGQDPYHGPGQAHGLSFSVNPGVTVPPSLQNIYKEIEQDLGQTMPPNGDLRPWAQQGVLLLNSTLSVRHKTPTSHSGQGWETFTDHMIEALNQHKEHVVFLLWGKFAQSKKSLIDSQKHLVLEAAHPSPFSAHNGFFGCRHFSKANTYLKNHGLEPIDWSI